jgi:CheY-like chemotaxis protein
MAKILIVEDDPLMARLYEKVFKFEGHEVDVALNGRDGLDKVRANRPNVMVLDIMMPEMNGLEVLDKLKADPDTKTIPVVVLTNLAGGQDAEAALTKGAVKYIVKSEYEPKQIANMIKEVLAGYTRNEVPSVASV